MASRYNNRLTSVNNNRLYKNTFKDRNVKFIRQYRTATLTYPTKEQIRQLQDQLNVANNINITLENAIDKDSSSISKKFMEDAIDEMYNEPDDPFTGF